MLGVVEIVTLCAHAPEEGVFVKGVWSHITSPSMKIKKAVDHVTGAGYLQKEAETMMPSALAVNNLVTLKGALTLYSMLFYSTWLENG